MAAVRRVALAPDVQRQLDIAVARLVVEYNPERIYLYGSQARGDATVDSDIDLLVLMPDGFRANLKELMRVTGLMEHGASNVNVEFAPLGAYLARVEFAASLAGTIEREGSLLYERR